METNPESRITNISKCKRIPNNEYFKIVTNPEQRIFHTSFGLYNIINSLSHVSKNHRITKELENPESPTTLREFSLAAELFRLNIENTQKKP